MRKYKAQKSLKKVFVVTLSAALFLGSTLAVYAAESGVTEGYDKVYEASWDGTSEIINGSEENTLVEYYEESPVNEDIVVEYFEDSYWARSSTVAINFTISAKSEKRGSSHKLNKGNTVVVGISVDPSNKNVRVGLVKSDGSIRYVSGSGQIHHTFTIYESGYYRFFIQNSNSTSVYVAGYYAIN